MWPSILKNMRGETGLVMRDLYSVFTFEKVHNLHLILFQTFEELSSSRITT